MDCAVGRIKNGEGDPLVGWTCLARGGGRCPRAGAIAASGGPARGDGGQESNRP